MGWSGGGEVGFSVILVVVCRAPRKTLTRVWVEWGVGRGWGASHLFWWLCAVRLVKPLPVCGVERGWGVELGFSVILVVVCSAPRKTLIRVWGGARVGR